MELVGKLPGGFMLGRLSLFLLLLALGFVQQLYFIALTLNYYDQRMRKENWAPTLTETSANLGHSDRH